MRVAARMEPIRARFIAMWNCKAPGYIGSPIAVLLELLQSKEKVLAIDTNDGQMQVAVIGTGLIGRKHIGLIAENPKLAVAATVNPNGSPADIAALGIPNFSSCEEMVRTMKIGGAIVASPNETHADIAVELIRAGIPVLIEKPIAGTVEQGQRIIAAAQEHDVPVLMGHHRRYNPILAEMREIAHSDRLGGLVGFSGVWSVYKPDPYYGAAWRTGATGGPIMINLIHEIDYLQAMFGRIASVGAMQAPKRRAHSSEEAVGVLLRFEQGVIGTVILSDSAASPWSWEQATGENDPTFPQNRQNPYRFLFERGAVEFPGLKIWSQPEPDWSALFEIEDRNRLAEPMRDAFARQIDHFHDVARGTAAPIVTARDGLEALNAAITVRQAIAGNGFLDVPPLS